ncbi:MAG TPA: pyridoxal-dependent decarboxylase [Steroidobacteraceae bacterium]|nr:pyridoxal-dependent decarboxylase [Steroidobacteraceae bacterium]
MTAPSSKPESLDPADWEALRRLAHRAVDDGFDHLQGVRDRPVWRPVPADVTAQLQGPAPRTPQGAEQAYADFRDWVLPYPMGNTHPRFWSWFMGNGTAFGAVADFLAAAMNPNMGGGNHVANHVEAQVLDWSKEIVGFPADASGLLVSGGSMANFVGLAVARNSRAGVDVRLQGVAAIPRPLVTYASVEVHSCVQKAIESLGLGAQSLRKVPVDAGYAIDVGALERTIAADRAAGLQPFCVIGNAATINTGATDDLDALATLCERERLWFHVDGAIGALLALAPQHRHLVRGMERADSVTLDFHKWLHVPFEAACVLVRDRKAHRDAFALTPEYLEKTERGLASGGHWFSEYGLQLSRGFRALKVWLTIKEHGLDRFGRLIDRNIAQAHELAALVRATDELALVAPVHTNIVCFRYDPGGLDTARLNALNQELLVRLQESGIAAPSYTTLGEVYCLRVAIANFRTTSEDLVELVRAVLEIGRALATESPNSG